MQIHWMRDLPDNSGAIRKDGHRVVERIPHFEHTRALESIDESLADLGLIALVGYVGLNSHSHMMLWVQHNVDLLTVYHGYYDIMLHSKTALRNSLRRRLKAAWAY